MIYERDNSDPIGDMLERTRIRGRITLHSNDDNLPSNWDIKNSYSYNDYFKDIVDTLCLNPSKLKKVFDSYGIGTEGDYPDIDSREGNEVVSYEAFAEELENQSSGANLVFMVIIPLKSLIERECIIDSLIIPAGNYCGMFSALNGGGSLMEMPLLRDLEIFLNKTGKTSIDRFVLDVDEPGCNHYCIDEVFGMDHSMWGEPFQIAN